MDAKRRPRDVGKKVSQNNGIFQGHVGFPIVEPMFSKVRTSSLEHQIARHRSHIGKKLPEGESGKQDELKKRARETQERAKSSRGAAQKHRETFRRRLTAA